MCISGVKLLAFGQWKEANVESNSTQLSVKASYNSLGFFTFLLQTLCAGEMCNFQLIRWKFCYILEVQTAPLKRDDVHLIFFNTSYSLFLYPQLEKQVDVDRSDKINLLSLSLLTDMGVI